MHTLSPLEKKARRAVVYFLNYVGFGPTSIAHIMNMHQSTTSRMASDMPKKWNPNKDLFMEQFVDE